MDLESGSASMKVGTATSFSVSYKIKVLIKYRHETCMSDVWRWNQSLRPLLLIIKKIVISNFSLKQIEPV